MLFRSGIHVLDNDSQYLPVDGNIPVRVSGTYDLSYMLRHQEVLRNFPEKGSDKELHLLLSHDPDIIAYLEKEYADLVLSGHLHGGQICLPGGKPLANASMNGTPFTFPFHEQDGKKVIISRGIGTSLLPLRFCCPPEIIILTVH